MKKKVTFQLEEETIEALRNFYFSKEGKIRGISEETDRALQNYYEPAIAARCFEAFERKLSKNR